MLVEVDFPSGLCRLLPRWATLGEIRLDVKAVLLSLIEAAQGQ